jgi:hypothetical protein
MHRRPTRRRPAPWLVGAAAATALACGDAPTERAAASGAPDAARLLGPGGTATYVLASAGALAEPVAKFDHLCATRSGTVVRQTTVVFDTLTLRADGTAARASTLEERTDGVADSARTSHLVATGTWMPAAFPANWHYYGGKGGVTLRLTYPLQNGGSSSYAWHLVLDAAGRLTSPMAFGGACVGPETAGDGRQEEAAFTRR